VAKRARRRYDILSIAGLPLGLALVLLGHVIEDGHIGSLLQGAAAIIVFGGTLGAVLLSFPMRDVREAWTSLRHVFIDDIEPQGQLLEAFGSLSIKARKKGILSLEDELDGIADPFLRRGLRLAVDGTNPTTLRHMLEAENDAHADREEAPARVYESAGGYAPTVGILGAVLGLIHVMENLSDPSRLGAGIAVAFVATVYGVGTANLVLLPIASKLRARAQRRARRRDLITEGVLAIQEGQNPRLIDQKMRGLLAAEEPEPVARKRRGRAA
jgi:chemotaxis protein MotA